MFAIMYHSAGWRFTNYFIPPIFSRILEWYIKFDISQAHQA